MNNYISGKCCVLRSRPANSSFKPSCPFVSRNVTIKTALINIHPWLFDFPHVFYLVQKFIESEFPVDLSILIAVPVYRIFKTFNSNAADLANLTTKLANIAVVNSLNEFGSRIDIKRRCFAYEAVEQIDCKHSGHRNKPYNEFSQPQIHNKSIMSFLRFAQSLS